MSEPLTIVFHESIAESDLRKRNFRAKKTIRAISGFVPRTGEFVRNLVGIGDEHIATEVCWDYGLNVVNVELDKKVGESEQVQRMIEERKTFGFVVQLI